MNAMIQALTTATHRKPPFISLFKGVVGGAFGLLILIGAAFYLAGYDFSPIEQIGAGVIGAIAGGVGAYRSFSDD
jgi:hypothetical protein